MIQISRSEPYTFGVTCNVCRTTILAGKSTSKEDAETDAKQKGKPYEDLLSNTHICTSCKLKRDKQIYNRIF